MSKLFGALLFCGALALPLAAFADGKGIFIEQHCSNCHTVASQGIAADAKDSIDVSNAGLHDERWLTSWLRKEIEKESFLSPGDKVRHKASWTGTDGELAVLVAWLTGLEVSGAPKPAEPAKAEATAGAAHGLPVTPPVASGKQTPWYELVDGARQTPVTFAGDVDAILTTPQGVHWVMSGKCTNQAYAVGTLARRPDGRLDVVVFRLDNGLNFLLTPQPEVADGGASRTYSGGWGSRISEDRTDLVVRRQSVGGGLSFFLKVGFGGVIPCTGTLALAPHPKLPPFLSYNVGYRDGRTGDDGALNGAEFAELVLTVTNDGPGYAGPISGTVVPDLANVLTEPLPEFAIPGLGPKREVVIRHAVHVLPRVGNGNVKLAVQVREKDGNDAKPMTLTMETREQELPKLAIQPNAVVGDSGDGCIRESMPLGPDPPAGCHNVPGKGNGNGVFENGETVEIDIAVENTGSGDAYDPFVEVAIPDEYQGSSSVVTYVLNRRPDGSGIWRRSEDANTVLVPVLPPGENPTGEKHASDQPEMLDTQQGAWRLRAGQVGHARLTLTANYDAKLKEFALNVTAMDFRSTRGIIEPVSARLPYPAGTQKPLLVYDYVIHDGNSPNSRGNSNGVIDQGEIIELDVAVENRGEVGPPGGTLTLQSLVPEVEFVTATVVLGSLASGSPVQRSTFIFAVKRIAPIGILPVKLTLAAPGFDDVEDTINFEVVPDGVQELVLAGKLEVGAPIFVPVAFPGPGAIRRVEQVPGSPDMLIAATSTGALLLSRDRGRRWTKVATIESSAEVTSAALDPADERALFAVTTDGKLHVSADGGATWSVKEVGVDVHVTALVVVPRPKATSACLVTTTKGVFFSLDGGATWAIAAGSAEGGAGRLVVSPWEVNRLIFIGMNGAVLLSKDFGLSFVAVTVADPSVTAAAFGLGNTLFFGLADGRLFRSPDRIGPWQQLAGGVPYRCPSGCPVTAIGHDLKSGAVFAAVARKGVLRLTSGSKKGVPLLSRLMDAGLANPKALDTCSLMIDRQGALLLHSGEGLSELSTVAKSETLSQVGFKFGSAKLTDAAMATLDRFHTDLAQLGGRILVLGHTDNVGVAESNLQLSQQRALAVRAYLTGKGVEVGRIVATGYGMSRPIHLNATEAGRAENRRVEIAVVNTP